MTIRPFLASLAGLALLAPSTAMAAVDSGDSAWILTSTALVLFNTLNISANNQSRRDDRKCHLESGEK